MEVMLKVMMMMTSFNGLSVEELRLLYRYDEETGKLFSVSTDQEVGYDNGFGYLRTSIKDKKIVIHRLIWLLQYGYLPDKDLDHINGNRKDNRLVNLRLATRAENLQNQTTAKGFHWSCVANRWCASMRDNYKKIHLGYFDTELDARAAYMSAKRERHPFAFTA